MLDAQPFTLEHNRDSEESSDMSTDEPDDKSDETQESGSSDEEDDIRDSDSQEQDDPDLDLEATLGEDVLRLAQVGTSVDSNASLGGQSGFWVRH